LYEYLEIYQNLNREGRVPIIAILLDVGKYI